MWVCENCGSDKVRETVFRWINSGEVIEEYGRVFDDPWCEECDSETKIEESE